MQFVLIPDYLAKRSRDEGWECEQRLGARPAAKRQGFGGIPSADLASLPRRVAFLQAGQRFRRWILSTLQARREFIADGSIHRFQPAQLRVDFRSHHEAGELSGEEIKRDECQGD